MKRFFFAWAFPSVFVLMGTGILVWAGSVLVQGMKSAGWPGVEGVVTSSSIGSRNAPGGGARSSFAARVTYEYAVAGETYTGERIAFDAGHASGDPADARAVVDRYPKGAAVTVYHRPQDPADSVLERGTAHTTWGLLAIGAIFFAAGIAGLCFMPRAIARGRVRIR